MRRCRPRKIITILALFTCLLCVTAAARVMRPTPEEQLCAKGYEVTEEGLRNALRSRDKWAVVYAMRTIGKKEREEVVKYLSELLRLMANSDELVRVEAAIVVARKVKMAEAIRVLIEEVNRGRDIRRRLDAAGSLADLGRSEGFPLVTEVLLSDSSTMAQRIHAARLLRRFIRFKEDGVDVVPSAIACIEKYPELVTDKQGAVGKCGPLLFRYLADCLAETGDERAIPTLVRSQSFSDERVVSAAESALERILEKKNSEKSTNP